MTPVAVSQPPEVKRDTTLSMFDLSAFDEGSKSAKRYLN